MRLDFKALSLTGYLAVFTFTVEPDWNNREAL
jgi:hypothetical protein